MIKVLDIVGARPQFIKLGAILKAIAEYNRTWDEEIVQEILVHTGQHYDYNMSETFFEGLELKKPDYFLGVGSGSHGYQTAEMLKRIEEVALKETPDVVMVYGDTNSTLAGALAAAKLHIPVAHVEAGLRSYNRLMPEEINRVLTDHLSTLLFCPTDSSVKNLSQEGIIHGVHQVGDVMCESVLQNAKLAEEQSRILDRLKLNPKGYALATLHRAENTDNPERLESIFRAFDALMQDRLPIVLPLHPRTKKQLEAFGMNAASQKLRVIEPVSYLDMLKLEKSASIILTDSGGVQKEACWLRVPCVTLRDETEWIETVESGWNILAGASPEKIVSAFRAHRGKSLAQAAPPAIKSNAGEKIVKLLVSAIGKPAEMIS